MARANSSTAHTLGEFLQNLSELSGSEDGGEFTVELESPLEREKFIECAFETADYISLQSPREVLADVLNPRTEIISEVEVDPLLCKECGDLAVLYMECSCGTYAWCERHEDTTVFYDHADHECSPECCERSHEAQKVSAAELEASVSMIEVWVEEQEGEENQSVFKVVVRRKSEEERLRELECLMMNYEVTELGGKLNHIIACNLPPLIIGDKVVLKPHFMSRPLLALAVVSLNRKLIAQVIGKNSERDDYVLLLPEGVKIPGHSEPSLDDGGRHRVSVSRSEIEPVFT